MHLYLPSLEEKRFIVLSNISQTEALQQAEEFTNRVKSSRRLKGESDTGVDDDMIFYTNTFDFSGFQGFDPVTLSEFIMALLENLSISDIAGTRGARAIFLDLEKNIFGIGTTVVYNRNWATLNVFDDTVEEKVKLILNEFDLLEEEEDMSDHVEEEEEEEDTSEDGPSGSWYGISFPRN